MELTAEYLAGLFDGDGHVGVYFHKCSRLVRGGYYVLDAAIAQTYWDEMLFELQHMFGGYVAPGFSWKAQNLQALDFLLFIRPHVLLKKEQVELAVEFQQSKKRWRGKNNNPVTDEEFNYRKNIAEKIKNLKGINNEPLDDDNINAHPDS